MFTKAQAEAINSKAQNIVVSAAAGSGKTFVLVNRVISRIVNERLNIDDFLITTYTKKAAAELKERLLSEINNKITELEKAAQNIAPNNPPADIADIIHHLRSQIIRFSRANISTVHSFCSTILKNNFYLANIQPDFTMLDTSQTLKLKKLAADSVLSRAYTSGDSVFKKLVLNYGGRRDDSALESAILDIADYSMVMPDPINWLQKCCHLPMQNNGVESLYQNADAYITRYFGKDIIFEFTIALSQAVSKMHAAMEIAAEYKIDCYYNQIKREAEEIKTMASHLKNCSWDEAYIYINSHRFSNLIADDAAKKIDAADRKLASKARDAAKDVFKKAIVKCFPGDSKTMLDDLIEVQPQITCLCHLVMDYLTEYAQLKNDDNALDYSDLEHKTLQLFQNNPQVIPRFVEVYVDEFQDINYAQAKLFDLLTNEVDTLNAPDSPNKKTSPNCFMVGDIKQCIYRFRNSAPEIFAQKIKNEADNFVVRLKENFRSDNAIIKNVNAIFARLMSNALGEVDYDSTQKLELPPDKPTTDGDVEFYVIEKQNSVDAPAKEAQFVCDKIKETLQTSMVYDKKTKAYRHAEYSDIVILSRSAPERIVNSFIDTFAQNKIPFVAAKDTNFFNLVEVVTYLSLLNVIDNPYQDIPLLAAMRSSIFRYTDEQLATIRMRDYSAPFYELVKDEPIGKNISDFQAFTRTHTLCQTLDYINDTLNLSIIYPNEFENINYIKVLAQAFEGSETRTLYDFLEYLTLAIETKSTMTEKSASLTPSVRMMTVHASKGLEFPIVFLVNVGGKFNLKDLAQPILYAPNGIAADYVDALNFTKRPTVYTISMRIAKQREMISEEMRVLYVALTRAIHKLYVVASVTDLHKLHDERNRLQVLSGNDLLFELLNHKTWLMWLSSLPINWNTIKAEEPLENQADIDKQSMDIISATPMSTPSPTHDESTIDTNATDQLFIAPEVSEILDFTMPTYKFVPIKSGVSALIQEKTLDLTLDDFDENALFDESLQDSKSATNLATLRGTAYHFVMQHIDFIKLNDLMQSQENFTPDTIFATCNCPIPPEYIALVNPKSIVDFAQSPLGMRVLAAQQNKTLRREFKFLTALNALDELNLDAPPNAKIVVQGVIDAYFEEPDGVVIIDYKTGQASLSSQAQRQIEVYSKALSKVLGKTIKQVELVAL
ncbi:MAG: UvrD-helicase domain-containing protein [Clostridiales bacterium]|jgi:ATP-dependent helicase/nuclease subunit A|nr:UvrD-helicase domain-containing protein [Clostridiales bacterium]